jgi:hypothetical protein
LQRNGFHVLEADDWAQSSKAVTVHSKPIHVLLADVRMVAYIPILMKQRSELQVMFVNKPVDAVEVLAKVRQLFSPPSRSSTP